jgi:enterochelin esterase-like enzyme
LNAIDFPGWMMAGAVALACAAPRSHFSAHEKGAGAAQVDAPAVGVDAGAPPDPPEWVTPAVTAPRVQHRTFVSAAAGAEVSYHIFVPASYDVHPARHFPVLYWLHGTGGGLDGIAPLAQHFAQAMQSGRIPPMLVVFPNGFSSILAGGPLSPVLTEQTSAWSAEEIDQRIDEVYAGMAYFTEQSPWVLAEGHAQALRQGSRIRIAIGDLDASLPFNQAFHQHLTTLGIPHEYIVVAGVGHAPLALRHALGEDAWSFYR